MDLELEMAHRVSEIGQTAWERLGGGRPFSSYRWYSLGEAALPNCSPTYITIHWNSQPVGRGTFWLKPHEWLQISSLPVRYGIERFLEHWPLLVCEAPLSSTSGLILPDEPFLRAAALEKIATAARDLGEKSGASFAIFGYIKQAEAHQPGWPQGFSPVSFSDPETSLEIAWPNFESYRQQLAKSTRRNMRLHGERAAELGIVTGVQAEAPEPERALRLIRNVEKRHHVGPRPWTRPLLEHASMVDAAWITARIGGHLAGCCCLIGDGEAQIATLLGLDYSLPQFIYVYYQIMYALIRCVIECKARILYGGGGAYELKRRLGFRKLPDDYMVLAATRKPFRWLVRGLGSWTGARVEG